MWVSTSTNYIIVKFYDSIHPSVTKITKEYIWNKLCTNSNFYWPHTKGPRGNLQDTHKLEFTVQMQIPKCVSTLDWSKHESHAATND